MSRAPLVLLLLLAGCGARTELLVGADAAAPPPRRDAGGRDAGPRDGGPGLPDAGPVRCAPDAPRVLATDARFEVEVDDAWVYYSTDHAFGSEQRYRRVPKCGGEPETILEGRVGAFTVAGDHLYLESDVGIERARLDGSEREVLYAPTPFGAGPIAVGADEIFFGEPSGAPEHLYAIPRAGGPRREVAAIGAVMLAVTDEHVFFQTYEPGAMGAIARVPIEGGEPTRLARVREVIRDVAVSDTHVYWSDSADSGEAEIFRLPRDAGAGETPEVVFRGPGLPIRLAPTERFVYFTDHVAGAIGRVPAEGGPIEVLDGMVPVAEDLAIDGESVFAVSFFDRTVIKIAR